MHLSVSRKVLINQSHFIYDICGYFQSFVGVCLQISIFKTHVIEWIMIFQRWHCWYLELSIALALVNWYEQWDFTQQRIWQCAETSTYVGKLRDWLFNKYHCPCNTSITIWIFKYNLITYSAGKRCVILIHRFKANQIYWKLQSATEIHVANGLNEKYVKFKFILMCSIMCNICRGWY